MKTKLLTSLALSAFTQEINTDTGIIDAAKAFPAKPPYSPPAGRNFNTCPFFGDTHLHGGGNSGGGRR